MGNTTSNWRSIAFATLFAMALSGCESTSNWLSGRKTAEPEDIEVNSEDSVPYVSELSALIGGDPATQAEIYADARDRANLTPSPATKLGFALVLATPGHAETNAAEAQRMLRELLAQTELMTGTEISLATIHLKDVEARMMLDGEVRRLQSANSRAATTEEQAVAQRIANVEAENRRLRQSLAEAEDKLEAITSIEREMRDQPEVEQ